MTTDRRGRRSALGLLCTLVAAAGLLATFMAASPPAAATAAVRPSQPPWAAMPVHRSHPLVVAGGGGEFAAQAGDRFATNSTNWSGYVDQGGPFTTISGQWVVPAVQATADPEATGTWIGIDGTNSGSLIQAGTAQETVNNQTDYYAWWETLPQAATPLWAVSPGDAIKVTISEVAPNTWKFAIQDVTSGQSSNIQVPYTTPGNSAEWIQEAPFDGQSIETLANYGTLTFSGLAVNGSAPAAASLNAFDMIDESHNVISQPGAFNAASDSFTVTYTGQGASTTTTTTPSSTTTTTTAPGGAHLSACSQPADQPVLGRPAAIAAMNTAAGCEGYWVVTAEGQVVAFGAAKAYGDLSTVAHAPVVAIVASPDGLGYWLATSDGIVRGYGDAVAVGDLGGRHLNGSIIAMAATPDGKGYWLVGSDGGIFTFGDAAFHGSTGNLRLNQPVVGIAPAPGGTGYWLVASDGGIFTFGSAKFLGSMGAAHLNRPVVGMTTDPGGRGYRMVASDGGIFSFGAPFFGSLGNTPPAAGVGTMAPSSDGNGYYMLANDGAVYAFGDASYLGRA